MDWKALLSRFNRGKVVVFADFIDPFCYMGVHGLLQAARQRPVAVEWRGFELNPSTPPEGLSLATAGNSDIRSGMWASVLDHAHKCGLDFPEPRWIPNTRPAHALLEITSDPVVKNPLIEAIYQAYFIRQEDIGQVAVLSALAAPFGLARQQLESAAADARLPKRLEARRAEAERRAFMGFPGFIFRGKNYFGALTQDAWLGILQT